MAQFSIGRNAGGETVTVLKHINLAPCFRTLTRKKLLSQNSRQNNEVKTFNDSIFNGGPALIPFEEIINTAEVTFKVIESKKLER